MSWPRLEKGTALSLSLLRAMSSPLPHAGVLFTPTAARAAFAKTQVNPTLCSHSGGAPGGSGDPPTPGCHSVTSALL